MVNIFSQARDYSEALQWYNYSLSFFKGGQIEPNLAKLQRNRASCFLQLKQLEKVRQHKPLQQVREINVMSTGSVFFLFNVSVMYLSGQRCN